MLGCRVKGEGHVAEHHHEVVVSHGAEALSLAHPLHDFLVAFIVERTVLQRPYEPVGIFDKIV